MANGGKVVIKIDGDSKGFEKESIKIGKLAKGAAGAIGKGFAVAGTAAVAAIGAIGTAAVTSYADFEQLVGGVDTLFKESSAQVQKYADEAYMACGLSANQYMDTITSFSASLLQSLGGDTAKAAEYGNQAVIDMSDNANKMGTSMESIQNAYQGFAKQNYTMLDNLKLGYGGTKEEMQRLLEDASKLSGIKYDISSFADITQAIHVIQTEMGITGTTAEEAATTIQGALTMTKASWENLMIGLSDPDADLDTLMQQFADSAMTLVDNLIPVISRVTENLPAVIQNVGTSIINELPNLINTLLPQIAEMANQLITVLCDSLSQNVDMIGNSALSVVTTFADTILQNVPQLLETAVQLVVMLVQGISQTLPELIPAAIDAVLTIVDTLLDNIDMMIDASIELIMALAQGLIDALPELIEKVPEIIIKLCDAIATNAPKLVTAAFKIIWELAKGIIKAIPTLIANIPKIVSAVVNSLTVGFRVVGNIGKNIVQGIWQGIIIAKDWLLNKIKSFAHTITQGIKDFFGIKSPSRVMRDEVGKMIALGLAQGIEDNRSEVQKVMDEMNKELLESEKKYNLESERLKDSRSDTDKKYLEELKATAEKERKIYDALQNDIQKQKETIVDTYKELAEAAFDSIDEVEKAQTSMADKLKSFGDLYQTGTFTFGDESTPTLSLANLSEQTSQLSAYADALESVKAHSNVPKEFFEMLREMSVEEGTKYANLLLSVPEEDFNAYINDWKAKQSEAERLSKLLYSDETEEAKNQITESFDKYNEDLEKQGKENAKSWGEGFIEQLKTTIPDIMAKVSEALGTLTPSDSQLAFSSPGGNTYNTRYYLAPSSTDVTTQLRTIRDNEKLNEMRGGY